MLGMVKEMFRSDDVITTKFYRKLNFQIQYFTIIIAFWYLIPIKESFICEEKENLKRQCVSIRKNRTIKSTCIKKDKM